METKFSKSPWMVTPQGPADANGMGICSMWGDGEELRANVDLIASAPDMYELLDNIRILCEWGHNEIDLADEILIKLDEIKDQLKKARGES